MDCFMLENQMLFLILFVMEMFVLLYLAVKQLFIKESGRPKNRNIH